MKTLKQRITAFLGAALLSAPVLPVFAIKSGWQNEQGKWRYYINNGYIYGGWQRIQNKMYCFDQYGWMRTSWYSRNGQWYWFSNDGSMPESQWKKSMANGTGLAVMEPCTPDGSTRTGRPTI